jgi:glycosyltransferase involved in cell wall biosynthesis
VKIVYVVESLEISGGVKVIVEHASGLLARGHDVRIVTKNARHDWIAVDVPVDEVRQFDSTTLPGADVHIATWFPTVVPTVRARKALRIFHFSQGYEVLYPNVVHRKDEIEAAYAEEIPKLLISRHLLRLFEGRFPGPYFVLPQAIRASDYAPPPADEGRPRRVPAIGVVGPFEATNKGIPFALDAIQRLRGEGRLLRLHRASQLPLGAEERERCVPDLFLEGASVTQMIAWYRGIDLLIHPSFEAEGFPLPPLEAMASGIPVVLTSIPSYGPIPEDAVSRVAPGDSPGMARAAAELLDDPVLWNRRRARGLEVAATFSLDRVLDELERILATIKVA